MDNEMKYILAVPAILAGLLILNWWQSREKPVEVPKPVAKIEAAPHEDWSGIWEQKKTWALLRLNHAFDDSLSGEYVPLADRPIISRFKGRVEGDIARFDLKVQNVLWHATLQRNGNRGTLRGYRDVEALLKEYGNYDRFPNGVLSISPRNAVKRLEDTTLLAQKRQEIKNAGKPVLLGVFERGEP
jgi:hypothetical protein